MFIYLKNMSCDWMGPKKDTKMWKSFRLTGHTHYWNAQWFQAWEKQCTVAALSTPHCRKCGSKQAWGKEWSLLALSLPKKSWVFFLVVIVLTSKGISMRKMNPLFETWFLKMPNLPLQASFVLAICRHNVFVSYASDVNCDHGSSTWFQIP